tara:strand:+ start:758 stop:949 length:192 start_codon:yes stop_codon:yes gene_type:complete
MKHKFSMILGWFCYQIITRDFFDFLYKGDEKSLGFKVYLWLVENAGYYAYDPSHNINSKTQTP